MTESLVKRPFRKKSASVNDFDSFVKWAVEKYPDSCLSANIKLGNEPCFYGAASLFSIEVLNLCGCGCPEEVAEELVGLLDIYHDPWVIRQLRFVEKYGVRDVCDNPLLLLEKRKMRDSMKRLRWI